MTLEEKLQTHLIGGRYEGSLLTEKDLTEFIGKKVVFRDDFIQDGVDDDETEDTYVMCAVYDIEGTNDTIVICYGNVTEEIGYVNIY